jgi:hypothetical protein
VKSGRPEPAGPSRSVARAAGRRSRCFGWDLDGLAGQGRAHSASCPRQKAKVKSRTLRSGGPPNPTSRQRVTPTFSPHRGWAPRPAASVLRATENEREGGLKQPGRAVARLVAGWNLLWWSRCAHRCGPVGTSRSRRSARTRRGIRTVRWPCQSAHEAIVGRGSCRRMGRRRSVRGSPPGRAR